MQAAASTGSKPTPKRADQAQPSTSPNEPLAAPEPPPVRSAGYDLRFATHGGIFVSRAAPEPVAWRWEDACRATMEAPAALAALERTKVLPN